MSAENKTQPAEKMEYLSQFVNINSNEACITLNQELTEARQVVDKFIYSLSHEFRAPAKSIKGIVGLLKQTMKGQTEQECLNYISDSVGRLQLIIDELQADLSLKTSEPLAVNVMEEVELLQQMYQTHLDQHKITMHVESNNTLMLYTDAVRFRVVLKNLMDNVVRFSDPAKALKYVYVGIEMSPDTCTITWTDNGMGISAAYLPKIFDPFFKGTDNAKGMGLGLYMARNILRKLGGSITVESIVNSGTAFTIVLPNEGDGMIR